MAGKENLKIHGVCCKMKSGEVAGEGRWWKWWRWSFVWIILFVTFASFGFVIIFLFHFGGDMDKILDD
jgi:hypothetical protein